MLQSAPPGPVIEIGTSAGYSTLWLYLACKVNNRKITTFEVLPEKVQLARETFERTRATDLISLVQGDARDYLKDFNDIAFCFLDAEKDIYRDCYDLVIPRLCEGGLLIADNAINHAATLQPMIDFALADRRVDGMVIPVGKGELYCRKKGIKT